MSFFFQFQISLILLLYWVEEHCGIYKGSFLNI
jgi:hypothetical protein